MTVSCCSQYQECSDQESCIQSIEEIRRECQYKRKLEQGINYYSHKTEETKGVYLLIDGRMYRVGKRAAYGAYTYPLERQEIKALSDILEKAGLTCTERISSNLCTEEKNEGDERACCKVILTLEEHKYNIHNYDGRALKESTCSKIKNALNKLGFGAAIEVIGARKNYDAVTAIEGRILKPEKKKVQVEKEETQEPLEGVQLSLFPADNIRMWG
ncbi:hypothetical protein [Geosporobacter ferrireducens]|uniref:Uncharacterized protein n=1 Tax=Geosporobacter ferrireducens TaxID=1424294 RepID=A0A1D8GBT1_9FIRM|nr:hypothetical protein [Geosporobacter ferrireducens]AOT68365.1 hypothetical protein Gferi_01395 [Geosporobacter ferrireducens]MTI53808.1 hypothetical protein [Geosporobacter ferrireducens]